MSKPKKPDPTPTPSLLPEATPGWFSSLRVELGVIQNQVAGVLRAELGVLQKYIGAHFESLERVLAARPVQGPPGPPGPAPSPTILLRLEKAVERAEAIALRPEGIGSAGIEELRQAIDAARSASDRIESSLKILRGEVAVVAAASSHQEKSAAGAVQASAGQPARIGLWGLLYALRRPEVQAGMGRLIEVAARLGAGAAPKALPPKEA